jgi:hypothetical protein
MTEVDMSKCICGCGKSYSDKESAKGWRSNARRVFRELKTHPYPTVEDLQERCRKIPGFFEPEDENEWLVVFREGIARLVKSSL